MITDQVGNNEKTMNFHIFYTGFKGKHILRKGRKVLLSNPAKYSFLW